MNAALRLCLVSALLCFFGANASAASDRETGRQVKLTASSMELTAEDELDADIGFGLAFEYRASRRLGVELGFVSNELKSSEALNIFDFLEVPGTGLVVAEAGFRVTPILAKLNIHLAPDSRANVYFGPVAGYLLTDDLQVTVRGTLPIVGPFSTGVSVPLEDSFAWGGHLGLDIPLGRSGFTFTAAATVLSAEVAVEGSVLGVEGDAFDLALLDVQAGFGYRF